MKNGYNTMCQKDLNANHVESSLMQEKTTRREGEKMEAQSRYTCLCTTPISPKSCKHISTCTYIVHIHMHMFTSKTRELWGCE